LFSASEAPTRLRKTSISLLLRLKPSKPTVSLLFSSRMKRTVWAEGPRGFPSTSVFASIAPKRACKPLLSELLLKTARDQSLQGLIVALFKCLLNADTFSSHLKSFLTIASIELWRT